LENPDASQPLHDLEAVFPLTFHLDWNGSTAFKPSPGGGVLSPAHGKTTLLGTSITLPKSLSSLSLVIAMHEDGLGWDLNCVLSALRLPVLSFSGPMRLLPDAHDGGSGARFVEGFHHVVIFDGHCNLCNASVDFISRNDPEGVFIFVSLQSPKAAALLERVGINPSAHVQAGVVSAAEEGTQDSVLLLTPDGTLHQRASAALRCGAALAWPWNWLAQAGLAAAAVLPNAALDKAYNYIGRNRYKWFGRKETCRIPTAAERWRFM
jgi:predicted DCC family thiol-disulfide oxidoreductase YuxK